jgi:hypothetical protein
MTMETPPRFSIYKHITAALESFPDSMTKKDLVIHCARYIAVNPEIYITPEWFAQLMIDDCLALSRHKKMIPGSRAYVWINEHKRFQQNPHRLRI